MEAKDAKTIQQAMFNGSLAGGAAITGILQLAAELVAAKAFDRRAAERVRDAMVRDITGSLHADHSARSDLARAIQQRFERAMPS